MKLIIGIVLGAIVVVFAAQNTETVTYTFWAWSVELPRALVVLIVFVFGLFLGWALTGIGRLKRRRQA